ncbi:MAG TPA: hypothetical protein VLS88_02455, partial [Polyangiales bacterium]|nr:hypothetical protein [Polyangiales bacterium]
LSASVVVPAAVTLSTSVVVPAAVTLSASVVVPAAVTLSASVVVPAAIIEVLFLPVIEPGDPIGIESTTVLRFRGRGTAKPE